MLGFLPAASVIGTTIVVRLASFAASRWTITQGRVLACSDPTTGSSATLQISPRRTT
jgi:hypothetical protein